VILYTQGHPKYRRIRRDDDVAGITYAPCKDTYTQCPEWKKTGMCDMPQYKDYMPLVCTDTCGYCKGIQKARSAITAPMIIDAIEAGEQPGHSIMDSLASERSKIHTKSLTPKADIKEAKEEDAATESGNEEGDAADDEDEESSGAAEVAEEAKVVENVVAAKEGAAKKAKADKKSATTKGEEKKQVAKATVEKKTKEVVSKKKSNFDEKKVVKSAGHVIVKEMVSKKVEAASADATSSKNKKLDKKSNSAKKAPKVLTARKVVPKKKEQVATGVKRTKTEHHNMITTTLADLSGAGSGETDTDNLLTSGDSPYRSTIEGSAATAVDASDDDDEDGEDEDDDDNTKKSSHENAHQRQNFQLNGDPEMIDLKPKKITPQPDLSDFPDKIDKSNYSEEDDEDESAPADTGKSSDAGAEGELDDLKIEELLKDDTSSKSKKKKTEKKAKKAFSDKTDKAQEKLTEGKISLVLSQNFNTLYEKQDSPSYQMLAGNVKKDLEKMIKGSVKDIQFSEVSVEGNPRQSGKTKVSFNMNASGNEWMKKLLKLVDGGDIDGLKVIKGSLEIEEE